MLRDLENYLDEHPHVVRVERTYYFLRVTFDTGITEYWALNEDAYNKRTVNLFTPDFENLITETLPPIHKQFQINAQLYPEKYELLKNHFIVKNKDLQKMGWVDVRFFIHDFAVQLFEKGWINPQYDKPILWDEIEKVKSTPLEHFQTNVIRFSTLRRHRPEGRRLIFQFMPNDLGLHWTFNNIWKALNALYKKNMDFIREDIAYEIARFLYTSRHPNFYRALFKQWFPVEGLNVYDLNPDWGFVGLAVLIDGGSYIHPHISPEHSNGMSEMAEFLGSSASDEAEEVDLLITNDPMSPLNADELGQILDNYPNCETVMAIVWQDDWRDCLDRFEPYHSFRMRSIGSPKDDNYILMIKNIPR